MPKKSSPASRPPQPIRPVHEEDLPRVSLESMNAVHAEEIAQINRLAALFELAAAGEPLIEVIDNHLRALLDHVHSHFCAEEAQMQRSGFPPFRVHKAEHDRVYAELRLAVEHWVDDRELSRIQAYVCETLPTWMVQHIATMDRVTAQFLNQFPQDDSGGDDALS